MNNNGGSEKYWLGVLRHFVVDAVLFATAFLLGSVYFARWSFIKTVVAILLFWVLFVIFMSKGLEDHIPDGWHSFDFFKWIDSTDNTVSHRIVTLPGLMEKILILLLQFSIPPICWVITYFRLKEKEV